MNVTKKSIRLRLLSILLMLCMTVSLLPTTAFASTVVDPSDPPDGEPSIVVQISKTVKQGGDVAPKARYFELEITPVTTGADISALEISGKTFATYGISNEREEWYFDSTLKIEGDLDVITDAGGLKITEKNDRAENWTYDSSEYILNYNPNADHGYSNFTLLKDNAVEGDGKTVYFTNTYTNSTPHAIPDVKIEVPISKTVVKGGDDEPEDQNFELEVAPAISGKDISGLILVGTTIKTWGAMVYGGRTLEIYGDQKVINDAGGLKITEKNDGAAYWTYDTVEYTVNYDPDNGTYSLEKNGNPHNDDTMYFENTYTNDTPHATPDVTIEVPISKTVVKGGDVAPGAQSFEFEVAPVTQGEDISSLTITGDTIATNGAGVYNGTLTIVGDSEVINDAGGLKITEKNGGEAYWTYDETAYTVTSNDAGDWGTYKQYGDSTLAGPGTIVTKASFTNTYTRSNPGGGGGGGTTYYTLHYESNGGTKYKDERYESNTLVRLDKAPTREGYTFTGWHADEELTERITEIKMTGNKTVYAGWEPTGVPSWLNGNDHVSYVIGYTDGTVRPLNNISRAEVAMIFFRLLKDDIREENLTASNTFADINEDMWCNTAISTMARLGVVKGRTPEHFDPNAPITRAEFAAICARFDTSKRDGDSDFTDIDGHWAEAEIARAATLGWIRGYTDGTFRPENYITRAEAMTMINRVLNRLPENVDDLLDGMNVWPDNQPDAWYYLAVQEATNSHDFDRKDDVHEHWTKLIADPDWTKYQN